MTASHLQQLALLLPFACAATAGFAILFNVPRRALMPTVLIGLAGYLLRRALLMGGVTPEPSAYLAALLIGTLAHVTAQRMRLPIVIFMIPAIIPLVPGIPAFTAVVDFFSGNTQDGLADVVKTAFIAGSIGAGLGTVTALVRMGEKPIYWDRLASSKWDRNLDAGLKRSGMISAQRLLRRGC